MAGMEVNKTASKNFLKREKKIVYSMERLAVRAANEKMV